ncbi:MAG: preprotein translocase subunit SecE [Candidatus Acidiferrales bacterium]
MAEAAKLKQEGASSEGSSLPVPGFVTRLAEYPKRMRQFFHETRVEMSKVSWPNRDDVVSTTLVVVITVALFAGFFAVIDGGLGYLVNILFKHLKA